MCSTHVSILFATKRNRLLLKPLKHQELHATSIWPSTSEKKTSIWEWESIHGTSLESTKCFHVLEQIDFSRVWEVLSVKLFVKVQESLSVKSSCQFVWTLSTSSTQRKPWGEQNSSSQVVRRSSSPETSASPSSSDLTIIENKRKENYKTMVSA